MENTTSNSRRESNSTSKSLSESLSKFISKSISNATDKAYISIWALLIQPRKKYTQLVKQSFHLTMASLDVSQIIDDHPIQVMMIVGGNATRYLICTLNRTNVMQVPLNLHIEKGTFITFLCNGGGYVHLSGYYKYNVVDDPDPKSIIPVHIKEGLTTSEELSDYIENNITYQDAVFGGWIVQPLQSVQQLNAINCQESEEKKNSKRKANSPEDEAAKRMKSSANSNENRSNNNCDDTENSDDDDDDTDDFEATSSDSDDDEIEIQESEKEDSQRQEKNGKQQEKEVTGEEANGKQKKKKKEEQEKNDTWVLAGGLQVIQLKPGTGKIAKKGKHVTIYYSAHVQIGSKMPQIDQCLKGCGLEFKLGAGIVLRGVDEGTVGMKVGEKRRLIIPPKMGYGSRGSRPTVPPHATLVYDVELIKVK